MTVRSTTIVRPSNRCKFTVRRARIDNEASRREDNQFVLTTAAASLRLLTYLAVLCHRGQHKLIILSVHVILTGCTPPETARTTMLPNFFIFARAQRTRPLSHIFPYFNSKTTVDLDKTAQTD